MSDAVLMTARQLASKFMQAYFTLYQISATDQPAYSINSGLLHCHDGSQGPIVFNDAQAVVVRDEMHGDRMTLQGPQEGYHKHYHRDEYDGGLIETGFWARVTERVVLEDGDPDLGPYVYRWNRLYKVYGGPGGWADTYPSSEYFNAGVAQNEPALARNGSEDRRILRLSISGWADEEAGTFVDCAGTFTREGEDCNGRPSFAREGGGWCLWHDGDAWQISVVKGDATGNRWSRSGSIAGPYSPTGTTGTAQATTVNNRWVPAGAIVWMQKVLLQGVTASLATTNPAVAPDFSGHFVPAGQFHDQPVFHNTAVDAYLWYDGSNWIISAVQGEVGDAYWQRSDQDFHTVGGFLPQGTAPTDCQMSVTDGAASGPVKAYQSDGSEEDLDPNAAGNYYPNGTFGGCPAYRHEHGTFCLFVKDGYWRIAMGTEPTNATLANYWQGPAQSGDNHTGTFTAQGDYQGEITVVDEPPIEYYFTYEVDNSMPAGAAGDMLIHDGDDWVPLPAPSRTADYQLASTPSDGIGWKATPAPTDDGTAGMVWTLTEDGPIWDYPRMHD